jgi:hypothetical protein
MPLAITVFCMHHVELKCICCAAEMLVKVCVVLFFLLKHLPFTVNNIQREIRYTKKLFVFPLPLRY